MYGEFGDINESKSTEKALSVVLELSEDKIKVKIELNHNKRKRGARSEAARIDVIPKESV